MVLFPQGQTTWKEGREERRKDGREGRNGRKGMQGRNARKEGMQGRKKEGKQGRKASTEHEKSGNFKAPKTEVISILKNARFTRVEAKS